MSHKLNFLTRMYYLKILAASLLFASPLFAQPAASPEKSLAVLFEEFKAASKLACGERAEAVRIGKTIVEKHGADKLNAEVIEYVRKQLAQVEKQDRECRDDLSLSNLFEKFKSASKAACGERSGAVAFGRLIVGRYENDRENGDVIEFVKKRVARFEREDPVCRRENDYIEAFKSRNLPRAFTAAKAIIDNETDEAKKLDVMIDLVDIGYRMTAYEKNESYDEETISYAKRAIEMIAGGVATRNCWGAFNCYKNKEKTLGWLNYIIGYISYFRLGEGKKAMPYFYEAAKYRMEFKNDAFIYQAVAVHYFDRQESMASGLEINAFINRAQLLLNGRNGNADDIGEGNATESSAEDEEIVRLYRKLQDLYRLRYNLEDNQTVTDFAQYVYLLINRPLLDPAAGIDRKPADR